MTDTCPQCTWALVVNDNGLYQECSSPMCQSLRDTSARLRADYYKTRTSHYGKILGIATEDSKPSGEMVRIQFTRTGINHQVCEKCGTVVDEEGLCKNSCCSNALGTPSATHPYNKFEEDIKAFGHPLDLGYELAGLRPVADRLFRFLAGLDLSRNTTAVQREAVALIREVGPLLNPKKGSK